MKNSFFLIFIFLLSSNYISAQWFSDVKVVLDTINKSTRRIYIHYDLFPKDKEHTLSIYDIDVFASYEGGKMIRLENVNGDVTNVLPGHNRTITWNYFRDLPDFTGKNLQIYLQGRLNWEHEEERYRKKGKISSVLRDVAFPGWGVNKVNQRKHNWWIGTLGYGLLGTGIAYRVQADQNYDAYKNGENILDAQDIYNKAERQEQISNYLFYGAGAVWASACIFTLIKGTKNQIRYQIIRDRNKNPQELVKKTSLNLFISPNKIGLIGKF